MNKVIKRSLCGIACSILIGCTDEPGALRVLQDAGYANIQLHGYAFYGCGEDDVFATKFSAKNVHGNPISGAVCRDLFKYSTIRIQ